MQGQNFLEKKHALFLAASFAATLLAAYFLSQAITVNLLFDSTPLKLAASLFTIEFILFLVLLPVPAAIAAFINKESGKRNATSLTGIATVAGLGLANLAFPTLQGLIIAQVFYIISLPFAIRACDIKIIEAKKWIVPRASGEFFKKTLLFTQLGLLVLSAVVIIPQQQEFVEQTEERVFAAVMENMGADAKANEQVAALLVENQRTLLRQVTQLPSFGQLKKSNDENARQYGQELLLLQSEIDKDSYAEKVREKIGKNTVTSPADAIQIMRKSFPEIVLLEKFFWLIYGLAILLAFGLIGNIVMMPLSMAYGAMMEKILIK